MVQFVLVRPGSTDYDQQGRIQGTLDIPLDSQGAEQVQRVVEELRALGITAIYRAPCQSAEQTAQAIGEAVDVKIKELDALRNIDLGLWQGMLVEDVKRKQPKVFRQWREQPETVCPPEGERFTSAQARVEAALTKLLKKHKEGTIALVIPEPLASVARGILSHTEIGDFWKNGTFCGRWEVICPETQAALPSES
ncbi:MAG: histidine phosphatase family protein [Pirellulales bacterium]